MVDSRNFKTFKAKEKSKIPAKFRKNPMIPLVIIVILALALIAINYLMMDILQWANQEAAKQAEGFASSFIPFISSIL